MTDLSSGTGRLIETPEDAERAALDFMRRHGYPDAHMFPGRGPDGGVDVQSSGAVAQVKATTGPVGRPVVQQIFGIAAHEGKTAFVFSLGGFTDVAINWAYSANVALIKLDGTGRMSPVNTTAADAMSNSHGPAFSWQDLEAGVKGLDLGTAMSGEMYRPNGPVRWSILRSRGGAGFRVIAVSRAEEKARIQAEIDAKGARAYELRREWEQLREAGERIQAQRTLDADFARILKSRLKETRRREYRLDKQCESAWADVLRTGKKLARLRDNSPFMDVDTAVATPGEAVLLVHKCLDQAELRLADFKISFS